jgi:SagB-type dehydrogenase family enzyme
LSSSRRGRADLVRVRRSPHLVLYWHRGTLVVRNYATSAIAEATPLVCRLLDVCLEWRTVSEIRMALGANPDPLLSALVHGLVARSFLQRSDRPLDPREAAMSALAPWNPEAGFFHTATKHVRFWPAHQARRWARQQALEAPMPTPVKGYRGVRTFKLPVPSGGGELARVARERRTWRRFSPAPITVDELSTMLGLSLGVQKWVRVGGRELPLKTSPSGGARHPVEGYVVAKRVRGLPPGTYHYHAGRHALERLRPAPTATRIKSYMPASEHFAGASALVLFTAVLRRQLWRYPYSRAYRAALIETGHVCQMFCLTATALGLAPFSIMGLADGVIEQDLRIDGITETVLYAAGVGRPPDGTTWAPLPRGTLQTRPNKRLG